MKLTIEIEFGNDAMQTTDEAKLAILDAFAKLSNRFEPKAAGIHIRDINGNTVGKLVIKED
jgi:hypothetical protein